MKIDRLGVHIECDRTDEITHAKMYSFYPVHQNRINTQFSVSIHKLPEMLKLFKNVDETNIDTAPQAVQDFYWTEIRQREGVADLLANGPKKSPVVSEHLTLMKHQQLGREIAEYRDRYAFFYDTRTGKTPLSLTIMRDDLLKNPTHKWLVICPLILIKNAWLEDAETFVPELKVVNCHAPTAAKRIQAINSNAQIYITNTESFITYKEHFDKIDFEGAIVDESSDMKSPSSKVSKAIVEFAQTVKRFYILSGTPAPNGEWEYYMQMRSVDYYSMPASYTQFKNKFFINVSFNPQYEKLAIIPSMRDTLLDMIKEHAIYIDKEDVLTTPGREFIEYEMDMPAELKKHYTQFKNELYLDIAERNINITAPSAAAKLNKLNQISSGFIMDTQAAKENKFYGSELSEWYLLDNYRFDELEKLLLSPGIAGEQVLIWANYRREFEIIRGILGKRCACVYGAVGIDEKNKAIEDFKAGAIQYLVANPASADKGLTLTNAHIAIYFSLNWSYELFKQSAERIYGDISKQPLFCKYYVMIAKGTIDRVLYSDVLQGKGNASYAVLNHLKGGL